MWWTKSLNAVLVGALFFAAGLPARADEYREGRVAAKRGEVSVWREGGSGWETLGLRDELYPGDRVRTGADGRVRLTLDDGSILWAEGETDLVLGDSRLSLTTSPWVYVARGVLYADEERGESITVKLTVAAPLTQVFDRGTKFSVAVADDGAMLVGVQEGRVVLYTGGGRTKLAEGKQLAVPDLQRAPEQQPLNHREAFWREWPAAHLAEPGLTYAAQADYLAALAVRENQNAAALLERTSRSSAECRSVAAQLEKLPPERTSTADSLRTSLSDKMNEVYDDLQAWELADARRRLLPERVESLYDRAMADPTRQGSDPAALSRARDQARTVVINPEARLEELRQVRQMRDELWQIAQQQKFDRTFHHRDFSGKPQPVGPFIAPPAPAAPAEAATPAKAAPTEN